jgi:hypothetical protein
MWFPYSLPAKWKPESDRERINDSLADRGPREFLVGFQLHNPVLREWSVELQLKEPIWVLESDTDGPAISIGYYPNEQERLAEVICKTEDADSRNAARRCYRTVSRVLAHWAVRHGRGSAIGGLRIADLKHDARWRVLPHRPSAQRFELPDTSGLPEAFWPVAGLYREARTSSSDRYRLLCCHAILERWARGEAPFDDPEDDPAVRSSLRVTQELIVLSGMAQIRPGLEGVALVDLPGHLGDWRESALGTLAGTRDPTREAGYDEVFELIAVANLLDLAAHQVLVREIDRRQGTGPGAPPPRSQESPGGT